MSRVIAISFNNDDYEKIESKAKEKGLTVSSLCSQTIINSFNLDDDRLKLEKELKSRISSINSNKEFTMKELFNKEEWMKFSKSSKLSVGRLLKDNPSNFNLIFSGKNSSNVSLYKKMRY